MPSIKDIKVKKTSKFEKQLYRPWDINPEESNIEKPKIIDKNNQSSVSTIYDNDKLEKLWRFLSNSKKTILKYLTEISKEENDGLILTTIIIINEAASDLSLPVNTFRTTLQNLREDQLIFNYETKPGRGGFTRYSIQKDLYQYVRLKFFNK